MINILINYPIIIYEIMINILINYPIIIYEIMINNDK
jgi:hypothetical protein